MLGVNHDIFYPGAQTSRQTEDYERGHTHYLSVNLSHDEARKLPGHYLREILRCGRSARRKLGQQSAHSFKESRAGLLGYVEFHLL